MNLRDVELLSAYLDGQVNPADSARLEARLKSDPELRAVLDNLRLSRGLLRTLPQRRRPRNFTLTPKMAGINPPEPRAYPAFRLATVLAALLFMASVAVNGLTPAVTLRFAEQAAPAYGVGGGACGNCGTSTGLAEAPAAEPAATEALPQAIGPQPFLGGPPSETPIATLPALSLSTQGNGRSLASPTAEIAPQPAPPPLAQAQGNALQKNPSDLHANASEVRTAPVPLGWQIGLGMLALVFGVAAGSVRLNSERKFRARWNKK